MFIYLFIIVIMGRAHWRVHKFHMCLKKDREASVICIKKLFIPKYHYI